MCHPIGQYVMHSTVHKNVRSKNSAEGPNVFSPCGFFWPHVSTQNQQYQHRRAQPRRELRTKEGKIVISIPTEEASSYYDSA